MNQLMFGFYVALLVCLYLVYKQIPSSQARLEHNRTATELAEIK